jgi:hypothetical protein
MLLLGSKKQPNYCDYVSVYGVPLVSYREKINAFYLD